MNPGRANPFPPLSRWIPSRFEAVEALALEVRGLLATHGLQAALFAVELSVREGLNNAVRHGNRGDEAKRVDFNLSCGRKWICVRIKDEGDGFNWREKRGAPQPDHTSPSGRGLRILARYASRIRFTRSGNQVTLWLLRDGRSKSPRTPVKPAVGGANVRSAQIRK